MTSDFSTRLSQETTRFLPERQLQFLERSLLRPGPVSQPLRAPNRGDDRRHALAVVKSHLECPCQPNGTDTYRRPKNARTLRQIMDIWLAELPSTPLVQWPHRIPHNETYWTNWPNQSTFPGYRQCAAIPQRSILRYLNPVRLPTRPVLLSTNSAPRLLVAAFD